MGRQVSASAALKANAEARAAIANGFQMWFTCELLSLEQQVHFHADLPSSYLLFRLLPGTPVSFTKPGAAACRGGTCSDVEV
jgi:hypothetical protein